MNQKQIIDLVEEAELEIMDFERTSNRTTLKLINALKVAINFIPCCTELCEHKNETLRQGDGFTYSVCGDCGDEI
tara:strand:+ start:42 stop:266 length:225 start_codon:yes stop_codon:yes gene_type:complete